MMTLDNPAEIKEFEEKEVMQHNAITSGRYDFTACQLDILFMLLGFLEKDKDTYRIYAKDIETITGREWKYGQLREATENMGSRMFEIETEKSYKQIWLFSQVEYLHGTGSFEVTISPKALPYFFDLKNTFTVIHLKSVLSCSSKYAKRLYALACQWRTVKRKVLEISELKKMLGLIDKKGNEQYVRISHLKEKVLDVAKKQINENTNIKFDYTLIKKGRSFVYIELLINTNEGIQTQIDFNEDIPTLKFKKRLINSGFTESQAEQISLKETESNFDKLVNDLMRNKNIEVKTNALAYLVGVYKKKGIIK